jgi:hypothetical protein
MRTGLPHWRTTGRWLGYAVWTAGATFAFWALLTGGYFGIPFAAPTLGVVALFVWRWPEAFGAVTGLGIACCVVAAHSDTTGCFGCEETNSLPWAIAGAAITAASFHGWVRLERRASRRGA